jgi:hypothetical protein
MISKNKHKVLVWLSTTNLNEKFTSLLGQAAPL